MGRPRKTNRIQMVSCPQINRFVHAECQRCKKESAWCALVVLHLGKGQFDAPKLTCARCRLRNHGQWALHPTWQNDTHLVMDAYNLRANEWKEWVKKNPPLKEIYED